MRSGRFALTSVATALVFRAVSSSSFSQAVPRILLLFDMEGASGVTRYEQTMFRHTDAYDDGRRSLH
jgi:hypothetical protein